MDEAFFCNSGCEANEAAIKIARLYGHGKGIDSRPFRLVDCADDPTVSKPVSGCLRALREQQLARVYPIASADPNLAYDYDSKTGAFTLRATGRFGDPSTVVAIPSRVTGAVTVSGAIAGEAVVSGTLNGRTLTVYPAGGAFSIEVAAALPSPPTTC